MGDAVRAARNQTEPPLEVLVIDDASEDRSGEVAAAAGATVLRSTTRRCAGDARNLGMERARGDVFAFLDADVVASPNWLERVRINFERDARIAAVGGRIVNGRPGLWGDLDLYLNHSEWLRPRAGPRGLIPTLSAAYRRDAVGAVRFPEINLGEDATFAAEVAARGGIFWCDPEIVMTHRHERLDARAFWRRQVDVGRMQCRTRTLHDRPGKVFVRMPALMLLFPHLAIVLTRMARAGRGGRALALLPWLFAGEIARIRGFLEVRREYRSSGGFDRFREAGTG